MPRVLAMHRQLVDKSLTAQGPFALACVRAMARLGLQEAEQAELLGGLHPSQWAKQKAGVDGHRMHVQRFDELPPAYRDLFFDALIDELARMRGKVVASPAGQFAAMAGVLRSLTDVVEQMAVNGQPQLPFAKGA